MTIDTHSDPSLAYTYRGFTGPQAPKPAVEAPPPWRQPKVLVLVGSACAMGLVLGLWATPQFGSDNRAREPMKPVSAEPLQGAMQIVVNPGKPPPVVTTPGRLEVLPPDMAAAAGEARRMAVQNRAPPRILVPRHEAPPPRIEEMSESDEAYQEPEDWRSIRDAAERSPAIDEGRMEEPEPLPDEAWD